MNEDFNKLIVLLKQPLNDSINIGDSIFLKEISNYINSAIDNSLIYDFLNSKVKINQDSFNFEDNISEDLLKNILNYFHDDGNIYTCYDIEIFHNNNELNKKILFYFKTIELITSYFIEHNERTIIIYSKYAQYLYSLIELFRCKVYIYLGYDEIPSFQVWNYQTQTMSEKKSKKINEAILKTLKIINSYNFDEQTINQETKNFLLKYYNIWWEKYKEYIDENFPALHDKLEYYQGLNIDIYFCKFIKMDESRFGNSDVALCVGMSKNENNININIREEINQILFLNDVYENIDDVVVTLAFDTKTYNENLNKMISIQIPDKVNSSIVNYYKETIDYENYIKFTEKLFKELGHTVLNKSKSLVIEDYIKGDKTFYTIEYSQNTSKEVVEDLSKRKKKENNLLIINKEILNNNMKKKYLEQNIYIKDIDDIFNMFSKLKRKEYILKDLIYPHLESKLGSLKSIDSVNIADNLINQINTCPLGQDGWRRFEDIIEKVLNFVFKDSFRIFLLEAQSRNISGTDIKDYIIRNNGINGFWQDMKTTYNCNNIIVECKNYTNEIGIEELRQVSDYLSKDTYGQFAIVFSRKGLNKNGREKQSDYLKFSPKKMILVLDENDIIDLIKKKNMNESPEEILEYMTYNAELQT